MSVSFLVRTLLRQKECKLSLPLRSCSFSGPALFVSSHPIETTAGRCCRSGGSFMASIKAKAVSAAKKVTYYMALGKSLLHSRTEEHTKLLGA